MTMERTQRRGLFARLVGDAPREPGPPASSRDAQLDRVLANPRLLINTRPGDAAAAPEFGVPDLADLLHQFPAVSGPLQQALRTAISRHEPRLRGVQVRAGATDHALEIHARLDGAPLVVRAALTTRGRIDLR